MKRHTYFHVLLYVDPHIFILLSVPCDCHTWPKVNMKLWKETLQSILAPSKKCGRHWRKARKMLSTTCWLISCSMNGPVTPLSGESIKKRIFKIYSKLHFLEEGGEGTSNNLSMGFFHTVPILKTIYIKESLNIFFSTLKKNIMTKCKKTWNTSFQKSNPFSQIKWVLTRKFLFIKQ